MNKLQLDTAAFVILLTVLPLVSVGTSSGMAVLWWLGLVLLAIGGVIPILTAQVAENDG